MKQILRTQNFFRLGFCSDSPQVVRIQITVNHGLSFLLLRNATWTCGIPWLLLHLPLSPLLHLLLLLDLLGVHDQSFYL